MRNIWNKIVQWILHLPADKRLHFVAGFIVAAFFGISIGWPWVIVPAFIAGLLKEVYDIVTTKIWEWGDLLATTLGGLLCQIFVGLGIWWGNIII